MAGAARQLRADQGLTMPRPSTRPTERRARYGRDAHGRLLGLSKVEAWTQRRNGRRAARVSPWRLSCLSTAPFRGIPRKDDR